MRCGGWAGLGRAGRGAEICLYVHTYIDWVVEGKASMFVSETQSAHLDRYGVMVLGPYLDKELALCRSSRSGEGFLARTWRAHARAQNVRKVCQVLHETGVGRDE